MTGPALLQAWTHWLGVAVMVLWAVRDLPRPHHPDALAYATLDSRRWAALALHTAAACLAYLLVLGLLLLAMANADRREAAGSVALVASLATICALQWAPALCNVWSWIRNSIQAFAGYPDAAEALARAMRWCGDDCTHSLAAELEPYGIGLEEVVHALRPEALYSVREAYWLNDRLHHLNSDPRIPGITPARLHAWRASTAHDVGRVTLRYRRLLRRVGQAALFADDLAMQLATPTERAGEKRQQRLRDRVSALIADEADAVTAELRLLVAGVVLSLPRDAGARDTLLTWLDYRADRADGLPIWPLFAVFGIDFAVFAVAWVFGVAPGPRSATGGLSDLALRLPFMVTHAAGMALATLLAIWPKLQFNAARPALGRLPWQSYPVVGVTGWAAGAILTTILLLSGPPRPPGASPALLIFGSSLFFAVLAVAVAWRIDCRLISNARGPAAALHDALLVGTAYLTFDGLFRLFVQGGIQGSGVLPPASVIWPMFFCFAGSVGLLIPGFAADYIRGQDCALPPASEVAAAILAPREQIEVSTR